MIKELIKGVTDGEKLILTQELCDELSGEGITEFEVEETETELTKRLHFANFEMTTFLTLSTVEIKNVEKFVDDSLTKQLNEAIVKEDYEEAAEIRDLINNK